MNNLNKPLLLPFLLFFTWFFTDVAGISAQVVNIGPVRSWKKNAQGIEGTTATAFFRIAVCNPHILRVRVSQKEQMDDFSYVLSDQEIPGDRSFTIRETEASVFLATKAMVMELEKSPSFCLIFRTPSGKVISEDVPGEGFGTVFIGHRCNLYKKLFRDERFVGLGEALGNLDRRGTAVTLNNTDTYRYGDPRMPMYASIPFYIGIHDSLSYGLFFHNTHKTFFNFGISTPGFASITAEGGDVDYFFIWDDGIGPILSHYTALTGRMPLPPRWSLGYHQSRCSYFPQENVRMLAETFRARKIPADGIVLDADYLHEYEPFRINTTRFPDMPALTAALKALNFEVTASVNPGIKTDPTYFAHHDGLKNDIFVKFSDGSLYTADIAPSLNNYVDFTSPKARQWWAGHMKFLPENGIHGYWNDMNEPAVGGSYIPDNLMFDFDGRKANALEAKNLYGLLMARSSYEAGLQNGGNRRPFVLTRSGFAGVQRYAALWTGDNTAREDYIPGGALLNMQLGLSGVAFVGDDIGGYIGPTSRELFIRWIEQGVFEPFCRNHKEAFSAANEPWGYGEEAESIAREYIGLRYRLMPYLYARFQEASATGMPVVRSLCICNPFDPLVYDPQFQSQFIFGDAILVIPVMPSEKFKKLYLPAGNWYDLFTEEILTGPQVITRECPIYEIPLYVRASSVIPMQSLVQSTGEKPSDTLDMHLYYGNEVSESTLYEDDGTTLDYRKGKFSLRHLRFDPGMKELTIKESEGTHPSQFSYIRFILHGFETSARNLRIDGQPVTLKQESIRLQDGLHGLGNYYDPGYYQSLRSREKRGVQQTFTVPYRKEKLRLDWD